MILFKDQTDNEFAMNQFVNPTGFLIEFIILSKGEIYESKRTNTAQF